ncbi:MAG: pyridoxamine 5'-phosphate oxidase family protein [Mailhella sp.]|nr:pyridoxamine 5'-phosphate oxidase family protein [Mailhella sp.]
MKIFRPMRRHRQQLSTGECIRILKEATSGVLALLGDGGYPYAVPLSHVYDGGRIYFHSAREGHMVDAVRRHGRASFCVIGRDDVRGREYTTLFRSVIAFGRIRIIDDADEKLKAARMFGGRFNPDDEEALQNELEKGFSHMLMLCFDIEHLTGKEAVELVREGKAGSPGGQ